MKSKGNIEQLDRPSAIYASPQTQFVADFIGTMNLLPPSQNDGQLRFGAGNTQSLCVAPDVSYQGATTIAIRPEDFALAAAGEPVIDLGHYRKALVHVETLRTLKVYLPKSREFREGEKLGIRPVRYLVYREGQNPVEIQTAPRAAVS